MADDDPAPAGEVAEDASLKVRVRRRHPFAQIPKALFEASEDDGAPVMSAQAVRLWLVLSGFTYRTDEVRGDPTRAELAVKAGFKSVRSVDRYLRELTDGGWLTVETRRRRFGGGKAPNLYVLEWERKPLPDPADGKLDPVDSAGSTAQSGDVSAGESNEHSGARSESADPAAVTDRILAGRSNEHSSARWSQLSPDGESPMTVSPVRSNEHFSAPSVAAAMDERGERALLCSLNEHRSAHPLRNKKNNQENYHHQAVGSALPEPPAASGAGRGDPGGPLVVVDSLDADAELLAGAVAAALPDRLRMQLDRRTVRRICLDLAEAGWMPELLAEAVSRRGWDGARSGGIVVSYLRGLGKPESRPSAPGVRPPWCGLCDDERSRFVPAPRGGVMRCPRCGPKPTGSTGPSGLVVPVPLVDEDCPGRQEFRLFMAELAQRSRERRQRCAG